MRISLLRRFWPLFPLLCLAAVLLPSVVRASLDQSRLARDLQPMLGCLSGQQPTFNLSVDSSVEINGEIQKVTARLTRYSDESFDRDVTHQDYAVQLRRRADATAMILPLHKTELTRNLAR